MTEYNTLNVKLFNSQLYEWKSAIKNGTEVTLNLSSSLIGNFNDGTNLPHKLWLTNTQIWKICKAFANGSSATVNFSKTLLSKMIQVGVFALYELTAPFIRELSSLISSITDSGITLTNNEIKDIMKISKSLENRGSLLKGTKKLLVKKEDFSIFLGY